PDLGAAGRPATGEDAGGPAEGAAGPEEPAAAAAGRQRHQRGRPVADQPTQRAEADPRDAGGSERPDQAVLRPGPGRAGQRPAGGVRAAGAGPAAAGDLRGHPGPGDREEPLTPPP